MPDTDDVATPKRMTAEQEWLSAEWDDRMRQLAKIVAERDELRAQLAEARRGLEAVREVADRRLREQNPYAEREEMGRIADVALAKLDGGAG